MIGGTPGDDRIKGTQAGGCDRRAGRGRPGRRGQGPDTVTGGDGSDRIWGGWGADRLFGGTGADRIWGGVGNDLSWGDDGDDLMGGGWGNDVQRGGPGNDRIYAARGQDETFGDDGNDDLWARARRDVHGPNDTVGDTLHGGAGNDTFRTRDGEQDNIDCGPDVDTAYLDYKDVIVDATAQNPNGSCEVVNRDRRVKKGADAQEEAEPREDVSGD